MTDRIIRIKASRDSYRRGGLSLGPKWLEVDTSSLSPKQQRALLADSLLTIEGRNDDDTWSPMSAELRDGLVMLLDGVTLTGDGSGSALPPLTQVDLIDTLADAVAEVAAELDELGLGQVSPEAVIPSLLDLIRSERAQAVAALDAASAEIAALSANPNTSASDGAQEGGGDPPASPPRTDTTAATSPDPAGGEGGQGGGEAPPPAPAPKAGKSSKSKAD